MITVQYCRHMARYNAWQNKQLAGFLEVMDEEEVSRDRGAFFGSIRATLNHILWADQAWLSRLDDAFDMPSKDVHHTEVTRTVPEWVAARNAMDATIRDWVDGLTEERLAQDLKWKSAITGREEVTPIALCLMHVFSHQTHHRGQVHANLTSTGSEAPVSDIPFMPEDF